MKLKIEIRVPTQNNKEKSKVFEIIVKAEGVTSVAIDDKETDKFVVTGEKIDSTDLVKALRKKFRRNVDLVSLTTIEPKKPEGEKKKEEKELPKPYYPWTHYPFW